MTKPSETLIMSLNLLTLFASFALSAVAVMLLTGWKEPLPETTIQSMNVMALSILFFLSTRVKNAD
jgi:hypothetical protein